MPLSLYDPSSQTTRELPPGPPPSLRCAAIEGGPTSLLELRTAVIADVLQRQLPFREYQPNSTLAGSLEQLAQDALTGECEPETLRYWSLTVHYRAPLACHENTAADRTVRFPQLDESERRLTYLYATKRRFLELPKERIIDVQTPPAEALAGLPDALTQALEADLDTPLALAELQEFLIAVNALCDGALRKKGRVNASAVESVQAGFATAKGLLGLGSAEPTAFLQRVRDRRATRLQIDIGAVDADVSRRTRARVDKDFVTADRLQAELLARGITLLDGPHGTTWSLS